MKKLNFVLLIFFLPYSFIFGQPTTDDFDLNIEYQGFDICGNVHNFDISMDTNTSVCTVEGIFYTCESCNYYSQFKLDFRDVANGNLIYTFTGDLLITHDIYGSTSNQIYSMTTASVDGTNFPEGDYTVDFSVIDGLENTSGLSCPMCIDCDPFYRLFLTGDDGYTTNDFLGFGTTSGSLTLGNFGSIQNSYSIESDPIIQTSHCTWDPYGNSDKNNFLVLNNTPAGYVYYDTDKFSFSWSTGSINQYTGCICETELITVVVTEISTGCTKTASALPKMKCNGGDGIHFNDGTKELSLERNIERKEEKKLIREIKINAFPNPVLDRINIRVENLNSEITDNLLQIFDVYGNLIYEDKVINTNFSVQQQSDYNVEIDFSNLADGIYFVILSNKESITSKKIMKF